MLGYMDGTVSMVSLVLIYRVLHVQDFQTAFTECICLR